MAFSQPNHLLLLKPREVSNHSPKVSLDVGPKIQNRARIVVMLAKGSEHRIREALPKIKLSVSSYDTAWVAMVPSPRSPQLPCFPKCIDWILENQHPDGSWGLHYLHHPLLKDALSSTLACILALCQWNVGEEHINRGLRFIGSNFLSAMDKNLLSPVGFEIIFPGMVERAMGMGLKLPVNQTDINAIFSMRREELERCREGSKAYLAYVAEGLGKLQDWREVMKYQRENGSLFNSPSTTAAALNYLEDAKALQYLHLLLQKFGNSVPTTYPADVYTQLCTVDNLKKLGISQLFNNEIKSILDRTYRCWVQEDKEIVSDISTCAMAFRLLRMDGYAVSSDYLAKFCGEDCLQNSVQGYLENVNAVLELYKASQLKLSPGEEVLDKLNSWSIDFLKAELSANRTHEIQNVFQEVDYALKFPFYATLNRLEHKRNIEHFSGSNFQILKTSYTLSGVNNEDLLELAVEDFSMCQSVYHKELEDLERWVRELKLDQLKFARQKLTYCYLSTAATNFSPEKSEVRMSWAKNAVLTTVVDDFFDIGGSREELLNLISLVERWDGSSEENFLSEQVKIVFSALHSTIKELGVKASAFQNRDVTYHIVEIWLSLMKSMMKEAEWLRSKSWPTLDEYMDNGFVSFALGPIVLPALYFAGAELSEDIIRGPEYNNLFRLVSTCGRLLNDVRTCEREGKEGKLNGVALRVLHSHGSISEEEAKKEAMSLVESSRSRLLRLVLQREGSVVPRACKDLFWNMCKVVHLFYMNTDGFTSPKEMLGAVNSVFYEPLQVTRLSSASVAENQLTM